MRFLGGLWRTKLFTGIVVSCLILSGCNGGSSSSDEGSDSIVDDPTGIPTAEFTASRLLINEGESTLLRWSSPEAESVSIAPDIGSVEIVGELSVTPEETTEYTLTAVKGSDSNVVPMTVTVRPLAAVQLQASVSSGDAPLRVRFTPIVNSLTAINRYYWDFEGDGGDVDGGLGTGSVGFDYISRIGYFENTGRDLTYTFTQPGSYTTRIRVWDADGNQADGELQIEVNNAVPKAYVRVSPTTGTVPVRANFQVTSTDNEGIDQYEWDFDGDGIYDETTTRSYISHTYENAGDFKPVVQITDSLGATLKLEPIHLQVNARVESVPGVTVSANPVVGPAPLDISMRASVRNASSIVSWAWDFNGDGVTDSTEPNSVSHVYDKLGSFYPTLTVTDENGVVGRDIFNVVVEANHQLSIEDAGMNPELGETSTINLTLNGTAETQLVMEDATGGIVKTFIDWAESSTGEYVYNWDGKNDEGATAAPGDYYAVLRYRVDEVEEVLDYRTSSGGKIFYPSAQDYGSSCRGSEVACGTMQISENRLEPFNNAPTVYDFSIPHNARVTAYVTVRGGEEFAPATFFRSRTMAAGDYTVSWHGEGTNGQFLPMRPNISNGYVPAIYGLTASDNAIFLSHDTTLKNLSVEPAVFYPSTIDSSKSSTMRFDLNRSADVLMSVDSTAAGAEVFRKTFFNVPAGADVSLDWDGRDAEGTLLAPGGYRISLVAHDQYGKSSLPVRAMQRIRY